LTKVLFPDSPAPAQNTVNNNISVTGELIALPCTIVHGAQVDREILFPATSKMHFAREFSFRNFIIKLSSSQGVIWNLGL